MLQREKSPQVATANRCIRPEGRGLDNARSVVFVHKDQTMLLRKDI